MRTTASSTTAPAAPCPTTRTAPAASPRSSSPRSPRTSKSPPPTSSSSDTGHTKVPEQSRPCTMAGTCYRTGSQWTATRLRLASLDLQPRTRRDQGPVLDPGHDHGTGSAVEFGCDHRADDHDGIADLEDDFGWTGPTPESLREHRASGARSTPRPHHEDFSGQNGFVLRMPSIDDPARFDVEAAPEAQRLLKDESGRDRPGRLERSLVCTASPS